MLVSEIYKNPIHRTLLRLPFFGSTLCLWESSKLMHIAELVLVHCWDISIVWLCHTLSILLLVDV